MKKILLVSKLPVPQQSWDKIVAAARQHFPNHQILTMTDLIQEHPELEQIESDLIEVRPACSDEERQAFFQAAQRILPFWAQNGIELPSA